MSRVYQEIREASQQHRKMLAVLLDPDKCQGELQHKIIQLLKTNAPDLILVGGSLTIHSTNELVKHLKKEVSTKIVLFPGNSMQLSPLADGLLYLSLISGRNADYLIGQHVQSAIQVVQSGIEVIPTGYLLIDGGSVSTTQYISNTQPIPAEKHEIALSTALAGELLGLKMIYLEAGSGAKKTVEQNMIRTVKEKLSVPLLVGGGITNAASLIKAFNAGADVVVVGNIFEKEPMLINEFVQITSELNKAHK